MEMLYGKSSFVFHHDAMWGIIPTSFLCENYEILTFQYLVVVILYAFGIGKHLTAILFFLFIEVFQQMNPYILNGGDNILKFFALYMIFCDSFEYFSISKIKIRSDRMQKLSNLLTNLGVVSIILHLCLIYFITGLHKIHSEVWFNGVATYYILSLRRFQGTQWNSLLSRNGWIVTLSTYATMIWEIAFAFIIWQKNLRAIILSIGVVLHISIYAFMMIYDFQVIFIATYGFFFADTQYRTLRNNIFTLINQIKLKFT
jgi:hypothetical protein